ncbi:MAG: cell envelope integrity protein CreD [Bacteroidota bacterium]
MSEENNRIERVGNYIKGSSTVKLITITVLMLLLLIPTSMVKSIIQERELLNAQATEEVSSKWANEQTISGPILTIPVVYEYESGEKLHTTTKNWHILPKELNIAGEVIPEKLKRGIYEVIVYGSSIDIDGTFEIDNKPDPSNLKEIQYDRAFLTLGLSDLRGVKNEMLVNWGKKNLKVDPGSKLDKLISSGVTVRLPNLKESLKNEIDFSTKVELQGSGNLSFIPVGNTTRVKMASPWSAPAFNGNFLPDNREVSDDGFVADWSVLEINRNYPQSWIGSGNAAALSQSVFGIDFLNPLDDYQKSYRSSKYAVLTISLTFLVFFLVEVLNRRRIHPFQYTLVGLAICLFYVLLVSISEHSNFDLAYGISSLAIVVLICLYSLSVFKKVRFSLILTAVLASLYGFLFVTLQLSDYALLMGSIGLTVILGATMYFTRNIDWYQSKISNNAVSPANS